jgi:hypothetical protein
MRVGNLTQPAPIPQAAGAKPPPRHPTPRVSPGHGRRILGNRPQGPDTGRVNLRQLGQNLRLAFFRPGQFAQGEPQAQKLGPQTGSRMLSAFVHRRGRYIAAPFGPKQGLLLSCNEDNLTPRRAQSGEGKSHKKYAENWRENVSESAHKRLFSFSSCVQKILKLRGGSHTNRDVLSLRRAG